MRIETNKKQDKRNRQGISIVSIMAGLALLVITASIIGPKFTFAKDQGYVKVVSTSINNLTSAIKDTQNDDAGEYEFKYTVDDIDLLGLKDRELERYNSTIERFEFEGDMKVLIRTIGETIYVSPIVNNKTNLTTHDYLFADVRLILR